MSAVLEAPAGPALVQTSGLAPAVGELVWDEHPILPAPAAEEQAAILAREGGAQALAEYYVDRKRRIRLAEEDAFNFGFELDHWKDADGLLMLDLALVLVFGGNRAGKSEWAAKRLVQTAVENADSVLLAMHESEEASIATQQKQVWRYLPLELKALNDRRHSVHKIRYTQANGFTEGKLVLPNRSEIYFLSYKQDPGAYEGWELGARHASGKIGAWGDENLPLPWLRMLLFRLTSRAAKLIWTYTPVHGMTPTIKDVMGATVKTLRTLPSELLPDRVNVLGCPVGHMPYVQQPFFERARVIYFHSILNRFGAHYPQIVKLCAGMPSEFTERRAYGFSRDVGERAFPHFGEWNVVEPEKVPAVGTNYTFNDPAGSRNWFVIWVRTVPGNPSTLYIYREWPDFRRYGEWAITAANPDRFDGDMGPAQKSLGYGVVEMKRLFRREEGLRVVRTDGDGRDGKNGTYGEVVWRRIIDSRAGRNQHQAERGGTCLIDDYALAHEVAVEGELGRTEILPAVIFEPASGVDIQEGIQKINDLLWWNREKPMDAVRNSPRLFVSAACKNTIWALSNWTGFDGDKGACKDPVDCVRYLALEDPRYIAPGSMRTRGGGSY